MKAVVVGAGIGGLAAGLALSRVGWEVTVLEQAEELAEVGAGLQISPNGTKVLEALNLMEALAPLCFEPEFIRLSMGRTGRKIFELPMKGYAENRWGAKYIHVHRADLHRVLAERLAHATGGEIRTGAKVTGYVRERGGASVYLQDGSRIFGDLVIGADGVHSAIRGQMTGSERARFTGYVAWRATVPVSVLKEDAPGPGACVWAGAGRHAVTTRIRGGDLVNFVGIVAEDSFQEEGWDLTGRRSEAFAAFKGFVPQVTSILHTARELNRWALFDRPPLGAWSDGPVGLLGDAAHPMVPSMAQGAVQALEDAWVLAACVSSGKDVAEGLTRYFALRRNRTGRIQQRSMENLELFHKGGALQSLATYAPIWAAARLSPALIHARQDWIYAPDVTKGG
jgi:salicylate hydroxylase